MLKPGESWAYWEKLVTPLGDEPTAESPAGSQADLDLLEWVCRQKPNELFFPPDTVRHRGTSALALGPSDKSSTGLRAMGLSFLWTEHDLATAP